MSYCCFNSVLHTASGAAGQRPMPRTAHYRSPALSRSQVLEAIGAHDHAEAVGKPLNVALHIHWHWTCFANKNRRTVLARLLEGQRHWLAQRKVAFHSIAVRENPPSTGIGEHVHQLVHIPPALLAEFLAYVRTFLRGNKRHQRKALQYGAGYSKGKLAYHCKGSTEPGRQALLDWFETDYERNKFMESTAQKTRQGVINGKRISISQALGPKAREAAKLMASDFELAVELQSNNLSSSAIAA